MLKNRTRKANMGLVANGVAPIGLMLDESRDNLIPSPHADRVDWLYGRFRALDANLGALLREVIDMARRGEPLFPDVEGWTPERIQLKRVVGGWTVSTRFRIAVHPDQSHVCRTSRMGWSYCQAQRTSRYSRC